MKKLLALLLLIVPIAIVAGSGIAATPSPQALQLAKQLRNANNKISDQQDEISAQDDLIGSQSDTIARLRSRIANWPDPVDVITNEGADDQWSAMVAIWRSFPSLPDGALCGYDKSNTPATGDVLTLTTFSFYRFGGC